MNKYEIIINLIDIIINIEILIEKLNISFEANLVI